MLQNMVSCQRGSYAGSRPIGYPEVADRFLTDEERQSATLPPVANRFGQNGPDGQRIPVDAHGDIDLINR